VVGFCNNNYSNIKLIVYNKDAKDIGVDNLYFRHLLDILG